MWQPRSTSDLGARCVHSRAMHCDDETITITQSVYFEESIVGLCVRFQISALWRAAETPSLSVSLTHTRNQRGYLQNFVMVSRSCRWPIMCGWLTTDSCMTLRCRRSLLRALRLEASDDSAHTDFPSLYLTHRAEGQKSVELLKHCW